jgi:hemolysin activation/secretion protein
MNHIARSRSGSNAYAAVAALGASLLAIAQVPSAPQPFVEQQLQQERERALCEQNERTVDQRLQAAPSAPVQRIPESESPCFRIDRVLLVGEQSESFSTGTPALSLVLPSGEGSAFRVSVIRQEGEVSP